MEKNQSKSDRVIAAAWALAANSIYGIPKEGKTSSKVMIMDMETSSLLDQQRVGRVERKSPHTEVVAIDFAIPEQLKARIAVIDKMKDEMNKALGIPKDLLGEPTGIQRIQFPELLDELRLYNNFVYKPKNKTMKQFKNRFAVKGDIINLLRFERELKKLGYEIMDKDVIDWRSRGCEVAKYITCGIHYIANNPGQFIPAANSGSASLIFNIDTDFDAALEHASQLYPLFVTLDGTPIYSTDEKIYGIRKLNDDEVYLKSNTNVYRGHYIITINYSNQKSDQYCWFSSVELAKQYIDNTVPLLVTEDRVEKFVNNQAYCVKPDFTSYWVKKGLDEKTPWPGHKYFHTDDAAQKYIDENKPRFSKKQVRDIVNNSVSIMNVTIPKYQTLAIHHLDGDKLKKGFNL